MEKEPFVELQRVLSYQYYDTIITDLTYFHPQKCEQVIEHFNLAKNIINNDKIKLNISPIKFYSVGLFISQIIEYPINISLRKTIIEFYCTLFEKINKIYGSPFIDEYILKIIFLHFYDEYYGCYSISGLEENSYIEDSKIRISSFKICIGCIYKKDMKQLFNGEGVFDKIIHIFYKKAAYFFQFLIIPSVFCNIEEDVCNIINISASIFDSLEEYLKIIIDLDNLCFSEKITNELLEKMSITIKLMFSTILGESIHDTLLNSIYLEGVKYNLCKIISFILKFTIFLNNENHIMIFKESVKNVAKIILKLCLMENTPTTCIESKPCTNYRFELKEIKKFLVSIQSKFNFLIVSENVQLDESRNEEIEKDIIKSLEVMEI
ncbi:Hypothetical protein SRAE_1000060100 [Strongyloides ratti]|uniref:Uncharacterized protein n=1 Tax=Strongyloides ratti TaxID=34506 RepID=A0A090MUN5_STRRB|nr:Hypothetical protein SRAE_1000060100 [Strongyloides ratti]CEF62328.1 Hypothetical protein SRAE_1000060100 [Strongyloides ratti]